MLHIYSKRIVMSAKEEKRTSNIKTFDPGNSIERAGKERAAASISVKFIPAGTVTRVNRQARVEIIRKGLPYETIEVIGQKANLPVKQVLHYFGFAQTTYNKKKRENDLLSVRDSEVVLVLSEVLDFGLEVFNNEIEKFHRWLKKPNLSLGGIAPESLFDSITGIQEVRNALNRVEYGNMA